MSLVDQVVLLIREWRSCTGEADEKAALREKRFSVARSAYTLVAYMPCSCEATKKLLTPAATTRLSLRKIPVINVVWGTHLSVQSSNGT